MKLLLFSVDNGLLNILFWNARSIKRRVADICARPSDVDVFICLETWLIPSDNISFPGFSILRRDRTYSKGDGILIAIRKRFAFSAINNIKAPSLSVEMYEISVTNLKFPLNSFTCCKTACTTSSHA